MRNIFNWYLVMAVFVIVFVAAVSITPASAQIFVTDILVSDGSGDFGEIPDDMRAPVSAPDHDCMAAMMSGVSGQVLVEYTVNPDGSVSDAVVLGLHHSEQEMVVANPYLPDRMLEAEFPAKPDEPFVEDIGKLAGPGLGCYIGGDHYCNTDTDEPVADDGGAQIAWEGMPVQPEDPIVDEGTQVAGRCDIPMINCNKPDEPIIDEGTQVADCSRWTFFGNNTRICGNAPDDPIIDEGAQVADHSCANGGACGAKPEEDDDEWGAYFASQALALIDKYEFEEGEETSERQQIILSMGYP